MGQKSGAFAWRALMTKNVRLLAFAFAALAACAPTGKKPVDKTPEAAPAENLQAEGLLALSMAEISAALEAGDTTSVALTQNYLDRIGAIDRMGPTLRSVLAINPNALADAAASDARRKAGKALGPLDGAPVLIKDNIESADPIPTTAGALALKDNVTGRDSPLVAGLRAAGAVILGKTNLSQWANFRSDWSMSGWSALGGQVRNPHMLDRNPCGSSSGSGAAMAASLAAATVGTETNGSIICPSSINGIVGFKPTVGLVSQQGIVPISASQDTAGPMTRTVKDAALLLTAMTGGEKDFAGGLRVDALKGARIGVARFAVNGHPATQALFEAALKDLESAGAALVDIKEFQPNTKEFGRKQGLVLRYEFKAGLNAYLASTPKTVSARTLSDLIAFNQAHADEELALFDQGIFEESEKLADLQSKEYISAKADIQRAARADGLDKLLADNEVAFLVAPSAPIAPPVDAANGDVWPSFPSLGSLAAIAGYPHLTVPMGTARGLPVGISFVGRAGADAEILSYGYAYEQKSRRAVAPRYLPTAEDDPATAKAMSGMR
jgi:amidase